MATVDLIELVKHAKEAGLPPADINALVAKEEERYAKELERQERQMEREERQKERDFKRIELEAIEADKKRAHELELAKLNVSASENQSHTGKVEFPGLKLPCFNDGKDEIDDYLKRFERVTELQNWGAQNYHIYLGSFLTGKALKTYVSLPDEILHNYDQLKDALLKTYSVDAESYRKKFRESRIGEKR